MATDSQSQQVLSKEAILAEANLMLFAGTDTASNSLSIFFYLLMSHKEVYEKVTAEIRANGASHDVITIDTINAKMPYLRACLKESMRILPAVSGTLFRYSPKEGMCLLGHFIPGGVSVFLNIRLKPSVNSQLRFIRSIVRRCFGKIQKPSSLSAG